MNTSIRRNLNLDTSTENTPLVGQIFVPVRKFLSTFNMPCPIVLFHSVINPKVRHSFYMT